MEDKTQSDKFDVWAIVELMGHSRIAGKCTEKSIAGVNMLRIDVPENDDQPAFTRFVGGAAIYAINPVDQDTAEATSRALKVSPVNAWSLKRLLINTNLH